MVNPYTRWPRASAIVTAVIVLILLALLGWWGWNKFGPKPVVEKPAVTAPAGSAGDLFAVVSRSDSESFENGTNKPMSLSAPDGLYLLVNYGFEARRSKDGKEIAACGAILIKPGQTVTFIGWDGTIEKMTGSEGAAVGYAQGVLQTRVYDEKTGNGDKGCKAWAVYGFTPSDPELVLINSTAPVSPTVGTK